MRLHCSGILLLAFLVSVLAAGWLWLVALETDGDYHVQISNKNARISFEWASPTMQARYERAHSLGTTPGYGHRVCHVLEPLN